MIKEAIDRILSLSKIRTFTKDDQTYTKDSISRIKRPEQTAVLSLNLRNLAGLIDYIENIPELHRDHLIMVIKSPVMVSLMSEINPVNDNTQFEFANAKMELEGFQFGGWHDLEGFIIQLLGKFEATPDRDGILEMLANLSNENVVDVNDNKFTQKLQVKTGLTTKANVEVKNPVLLKPFRTFREVNQPESNFVLRYRNDKRGGGGGGIEAALFEGDGGRWQLEAIANIKAYLVQKVSIPVIG